MVYIPATTSGLLSSSGGAEDTTGGMTKAPVKDTTGMLGSVGEDQRNPTIGPGDTFTGGPVDSATAPVESTPPTTDRGLSYVDQAKSTVAGQLGTLLGSDNPYITQARARAEEGAAGRGLLSSSIAGRAGEEAAIRAGIEVASQDAGTYAAAQGRAQVGDIATTQTELEGSISQQLQDSGYASKEQLQEAAQAGDQRAIRLQGDINKQRDRFAANEAVKMQELEADTARQRDVFAADEAIKRQQLQADTTTKLTQMGIDAQTADRYSASLASLTSTTLSTVNNILNNMDIGDVTAAMNSLKSFLGDTELGKGVYDTDFSLV